MTERCGVRSKLIPILHDNKKGVKTYTKSKKTTEYNWEAQFLLLFLIDERLFPLYFVQFFLQVLCCAHLIAFLFVGKLVLQNFTFCWCYKNRIDILKFHLDLHANCTIICSFLKKHLWVAYLTFLTLNVSYSSDVPNSFPVLFCKSTVGCKKKRELSE
jgi:hypothetical protein